MSNLQLEIATSDSLDVRQFSVNERLNAIFQVDVVVLSSNPSIEFDEVVGRPAMFAVNFGAGVRFWRGICSDIQLVKVAHESSLLDAAKAVGGAISKGQAAVGAAKDAIDIAKNPGQAFGRAGDIAAKVGAAVTAAMDLKSVLSGANPSGAHTYHLSIVPELWFATQKRNYKIYQQKSELDIVLEMLKEHWEITPELRLDRAAFKKRKYRVQYGESDYAFLCRLLQDAGITFFFEQEGSDDDDDPALWGNKLILSDSPHTAAPRDPRISFLEDIGNRDDGEHVTGVRLGQRVRPGRYVMRDVDYRRPANYPLKAEAETGLDAETRLERFHYRPGAFLYEVDQVATTPIADDRAVTRTDEGEGKLLAQRRLAAKRNSATLLTFESNAYDLSPGVVMGMLDHPSAKLNDESLFLIVDSSFSGSHDGGWSHHHEARSALLPYHPPLITTKPRTQGIESATVVGPPGEEIHVDEFGRVRVHFHWDRDSKMDEKSSCWVPVSQSWAGSNYGWTALPRIGQEVIIDFLGADPDRPVVIGRVYTGLQKTPYPLPANKTKSGWKSSSSPGGGDHYNEISFEDKKGQELVYMQAEKDLTRWVKAKETVNVGGSRQHQIGDNDTKEVGHNQTCTIGVNRTATVGAVDRVSAGVEHAVEIVRDCETPTTTKMVHREISLSTGAGASIVLDGDTIRLNAKGGIIVHSEQGDVDIMGGPYIKLNTQRT